MDALVFARVTPDTPDVGAFLIRHFKLMRSLSPANSFHVMAPETLIEADVVLMGLRRATTLLAVGGLRKSDNLTVN